MTQEFTLTLINNSENTGSLCCFQELPDTSAFPVNWFAFPAASNTRATFSWRPDYQFVWSELRKLEAGEVFEASEQLAATLGYSNAVDFTRASNGAFIFMNQRASEQPGIFLIVQLGTIPQQTAAIGLNMTIVKAPPGSAGTATCVIASQPNIMVEFLPRPTYWVTFGDLQVGEVLDTAMISNKAKVEFPPNVSHMVATLDAQDNWTVIQET